MIRTFIKIKLFPIGEKADFLNGITQKCLTKVRLDPTFMLVGDHTGKHSDQEQSKASTQWTENNALLDKFVDPVVQAGIILN